MADTRPAGFAAPQTALPAARPLAPRGPAASAGPAHSAASGAAPTAPTGPAGTATAPGQGVARPQAVRSPEAMRKAAQDFEAQMLGALLQPMFETLPTNGPMGGGMAEGQWRPMLVEQFGKQMAKAGGVGIGHAVYRDMMRLQAQSSGEKP